MKKLIAILLFSLFVFNTIGYKLLFTILQSNADNVLTAKLDVGQYNEKDLITVRVPVNMPYQIAQTGFERVDGEITINGQVYKYVKRNIQSDTMTLLCIPHVEKTALQQKANEYASKTNDLPSNENNKKADAFKQTISDFDLTEDVDLSSSIIVKPALAQYKNTSLPQQFFPVNGQPPELQS